MWVADFKIYIILLMPTGTADRGEISDVNIQICHILILCGRHEQFANQICLGGLEGSWDTRTADPVLKKELIHVWRCQTVLLVSYIAYC